ALMHSQPYHAQQARASAAICTHQLPASSSAPPLPALIPAPSLPAAGVMMHPSPAPSPTAVDAAGPLWVGSRQQLPERRAADGCTAPADDGWPDFPSSQTFMLPDASNATPGLSAMLHLSRQVPRSLRQTQFDSAAEWAEDPSSLPVPPPDHPQRPQPSSLPLGPQFVPAPGTYFKQHPLPQLAGRQLSGLLPGAVSAPAVGVPLHDQAQQPSSHSQPLLAQRQAGSWRVGTAVKDEQRLPEPGTCQPVFKSPRRGEGWQAVQAQLRFMDSAASLEASYPSPAALAGPDERLRGLGSSDSPVVQPRDDASSSHRTLSWQQQQQQQQLLLPQTQQVGTNTLLADRRLPQQPGSIAQQRAHLAQLVQGAQALHTPYFATALAQSDTSMRGWVEGRLQQSSQSIQGSMPPLSWHQLAAWQQQQRQGYQQGQQQQQGGQQGQHEGQG
ncbi:hypothetical protein V8C86DRAFT_2451272, partial [Haematococcus lacustris]